MFHKWPLNGYVHKIHHGDWFGGKGVGLCRIKVHDADINVYVAHVCIVFYNYHSKKMLSQTISSKIHTRFAVTC